MINIIRNFIEYYKIIKEYKKIDFTKNDKIKLSSYDRDFEDYILNKINEKLCIMILEDNISIDFIRGFKVSNQIRRGMIREYFIK